MNDLSLVGAHAKRIEDLLPVAGGVIAASADGAVVLWPDDGAPRILADLEDGALCLARTPAALWIGNSAGVWCRPHAGALAQAIATGDDDLTVVALDARADALAVATHDEAGGSDHPIRVYGLDGRLRWTATVEHWPYDVRFSDDGREVVVALWDGRLARFDAATGAEQPLAFVGGALVASAWVGPDRLALAALNEPLVVWDVRAGVARATATAAAGWTAVTGFAGGIVAATNDGVLRRFDAALARPIDLPARPALDRPWAADPQLAMFPSNAEFCAIGGDHVATALDARGAMVYAGYHDGAIARVALT